MLDYLETKLNWEHPKMVSVIDDMPLWSAPFGFMLLDRIPFEPGMTVLDVGFGTGFPLLEIAQRLGNKSAVYGIDLTHTAAARTRQKARALDIKNVTVVQGDASNMEFADDTFDLIVSNTGVNNFENPQAVFKECFRVTKPGGHIALTTNPRGHMREFFRVFEDTLNALKMDHLSANLQAHIDHRHTPAAICSMLEEAGFHISKSDKSSFYLRFLDGSAFLNHHLIRYGFLDAWKAMIPPEDLERVFSHLEENLNREAKQQGELKIFIPVAYIEAHTAPTLSS